MAYNSQRADILTDICKLNHVEDFRLKLERYDYSYSMILLKAVNDIYTTYLVVYTLFRKNLDQIIEFRNVVNDETDSLTESIFMWNIKSLHQLQMFDKQYFIFCEDFFFSTEWRVEISGFTVHFSHNCGIFVYSSAYVKQFAIGILSPN